MASDALSQFVTTIHRLDSGGPRSYDERSIYADAATALDADEAWACLRQQQLWLASFPPEESATFVDKLSELANAYRVVNPPTLQTIFKAEAQKSGGMQYATQQMELDDEDDDLELGDRFDAAGWVDKGLDDILRDHLPSEREPIELFLFKTIALILLNVAENEGLHVISPQAITFLFTSIEAGSTHPVQRAAAHCCGILSRAHLPLLLERYADRLKTVPEKRFRWLLYQQATQTFSFGVTSQDQAEATVIYLESTAKKMSKVDRGKLRGAFCTSLYRIFGSIMAKEDGEAQAYWQTFTSRFHMLAGRYAGAFASIYATVAKWAKKAKHALPCWRLMVRMTCLGHSDFYLDRKRDAILPFLLKAVKETKAYKTECYHYVLECMRRPTAALEFKRAPIAAGHGPAPAPLSSLG